MGKYIVKPVTSDLQSEVERERGFINPQLGGIGLQIRYDNKDVRNGEVEAFSTSEELFQSLGI